MKNTNVLVKRIEKGIQFLTEQDKKLTPVLEYLTEHCIQKKEELSADKAFEYLIQFMNQKTDCLLLLTKMQEILDYQE